MKEYEINSSTMAIVPLDDSNSMVYEEEENYVVKQSANSIIKKNCEFYGSSYQGRCVGTKALTGIKTKFPIIIEESRNIIFFPTTSARTQQATWIALNKIDKYKKIYNVNNIYSLKNINDDLEESIKNNNKIRIWTTHKQIDSYLMFLYVCSYFSTTNSELYVLFSDEFDKNYYSPSCMNESELEELSKLEHKITKEEIKKYSNEWTEIVNNNLDMRIIENNKVKSVAFDYYNDIILNKLNELGEVKMVILVGRLMSDIHLYDTVFTYLIYRLIKKEKIIVTIKNERYWKSIIKVKKDKI